MNETKLSDDTVNKLKVLLGSVGNKQKGIDMYALCILKTLKHK
jgi:hypothetical protein